MALPGQILLPPASMAEADRLTIAAGTPGILLMERAGAGIVRAITARWQPRPVLVLCGPGNNGGDGYVVARRLRAAGWPVRLASVRPTERLRGVARLAAEQWTGPVEPLGKGTVIGGALVVDAIYGAGLDRAVEGEVADLLRRLADEAGPVVAVDVPSGIDGATGAVLGTAPRADLTVTFAAARPGHYLLPARERRGELLIHDIGIDAATIARCDTGLRRNTPVLWQTAVPVRTGASHKYDLGHALVVGGGAATTGAARLAAEAALRVGAGLVSIASEPEAVPIYAATLTAVMTKPCADVDELEQLASDPRFKAFLIGPGAGTGVTTRERVLRLLATGRPLILDADALTAFAGRPGELLERLHGACVLTPHEGEFARLFDLAGCRLERARAAAAETGATLVLKGGDSIVASGDGRCAIADNAPPTLATAGSGDVLAGLTVGLLAQGMEPFLATCAAVWLHGAAATACGGPLVAEDLSRGLARVIASRWTGEAVAAGACPLHLRH